jgi:hypothetical protein
MKRKAPTGASPFNYNKKAFTPFHSEQSEGLL